MTELAIPCRDCLQNCDAECTGRLNAEEWEALSKYLIWKFDNNVNQLNNDEMIEVNNE